MQTLRMLRWLYIGRLTLAAGIFAGALFAWSDASAETTMVATLAIVLSLVASVAGWWYTEGAGRPPDRTFLYIQVLFDVLLVTAVVHITTIENSPSDFSPLYVLVIASGALLLPLHGGMLIGALASILYFADMLWLQPELTPTSPVFLQIALFGILAMVTAALGVRLRRTGAALGVVESELRQLRLDTNDILAAIDTGLITVDDHGRLAHINAAAEWLLALEWKRRDTSILDELDRRAPGLGTVIGRTAETRSAVSRHEIRMKAPDGDRYLGLRTTVLDRAGRPWVTAVIQDITESKQIEDLVRRAERLQAVAELGASLAHEIKNPLASIRSAVEQLTRTRLAAADEDVLRRLVLRESDRLTRLLSEFMEFSKLELRRWRMVDLRQVASEAITLASQHPDAQIGARIEYAPPAEPLVVDGDQDLLHRAIFNLVLNAVQHSGSNGLVRVGIGRASELDVPSSVQLDGPIRLTVQDSGPGIRKEDIPRVFDPFFTTRDGGNGLGLAMVHRAVEAHRGAIVVDGDAGACFTVYLPAHISRRS